MDINRYQSDTWEKTAPEYARELFGRTEPPLYNYMFDSIASAYQPGMKILEVGCAGGHNFRYLSQRKPIENYTGLDVTKSYLKVAKSEFPMNKWVHGDARSLPFEDKEFDITFCVLMLLHLDEAGAKRALEEMCRVTKSLVFVHTYVAEQRYNSVIFEMNERFPRPTQGTNCMLMPFTHIPQTKDVVPVASSVQLSTSVRSAFNTSSFLHNVMALDEMNVPGWTTDFLRPDRSVVTVKHSLHLGYIPEEVNIYCEFVFKRDVNE